MTCSECGADGRCPDCPPLATADLGAAGAAIEAEESAKVIAKLRGQVHRLREALRLADANLYAMAVLEENAFISAEGMRVCEASRRVLRETETAP